MEGKIYHTNENKKLSIQTRGIKFDAGKTRWDLLPLRTVEEIVKVYTFGAGKYGDNNWQNLPDGYNRYKAAMFRHLAASERGEQLDSESGLPHLAHMAWNAIALLHFYMEDLNKKDHD